MRVLPSDMIIIAKRIKQAIVGHPCGGFSYAQKEVERCPQSPSAPVRTPAAPS